jgi:uncharacterized membrane protein YjdF
MDGLIDRWIDRQVDLGPEQSAWLMHQLGTQLVCQFTTHTTQRCAVMTRAYAVLHCWSIMTTMCHAWTPASPPKRPFEHFQQ